MQKDTISFKDWMIKNGFWDGFLDGIAFGETYGRWEGEALNRLRNRGWIFSKTLDVCICPSCAKEHGLIEILKDEDLA